MDLPNEPTEFFEVGTSVPRPPALARDLKAEILGKEPLGGMDPERVADAFERAQGILPRSKRKEAAGTWENFNTILSPAQQKDQDQLNLLMNSTNHRIIVWKDFVSNSGEFKIFLVYAKRTAPNEKTSS